MKDTIVATGIFSTLTISLNAETVDKLSATPPQDNPLKAVGDELQAVLAKFERTYFEAVNGVES